MADNETTLEDSALFNNGQPLIRDNLVKVAVDFLLNPNVQRSPINQKQKFLRSKGLNEQEIQIACEQAGVFTQAPMQTAVNMGAYPKNYIVAPKQSTFGKIREILHSVALVSGVVYAVYWFYKTFIEPLLFGRKKKKSVEDKVDEIRVQFENSVKEITSHVIAIREDVSKSSDTDSLTMSRELHNVKSDLESIKGLLLNRKQFASPNLPIVPPSIPAWQLTHRQQQSDHDHDHDHDHDKIDKHDDDTGSGSGSSETEVVTKHSDSSLEIIS